MKVNVVRVLAMAALMTLGGGQVSAQGFLKKLDKVMGEVGKAVDKVDQAANALPDEAPSNQAASEEKSVAWDRLPVYRAQQVYEVNEGDTVRNEDGTAKVRVVLIDQFGNRSTPETVKMQQKKVNDAVKAILLKTSGGAALGAVSGLLGKGKSKGDVATGAAIGAGVGLLASADDIKQATRWKKVLKQQEKLLEVYCRNYTDEGEPKVAEVDKDDLKTLDMDNSQASSMSTEQIKAEAEKAKNNEKAAEEAMDDFFK